MLNQSLDTVFQALGDSTRRSIVERLSRGPLSVSALAAPLEMSLPAVLQHLGYLERSGLVRSVKQGRVRTCHLQPDVLTDAQKWFESRKQDWEAKLDELEKFLEGDDK